MNRRTFLKAALILGSGVSVPLVTAQESQPDYLIDLIEKRIQYAMRHMAEQIERDIYAENSL